MEKKIIKRAIIKEELVMLTGTAALAVTLNQLLYWSLRIRDKDDFILEEMKAEMDPNEDKLYGWIYKTSEELALEIMLGSQSTVRRYLKELVKNNFVFERKNPNPRYKYDKTYQYRVNLNKIRLDLADLGYELEGYENFYHKKEQDRPVDFIPQIENSKNQNENTILQLVVTKEQNEAAIPEITLENTTKNISKVLIEEVGIRNKKKEACIDKAAKITEYYFEKSQKSSLTVKEKDAVNQVVNLGLSYLKVITLIDECYKKFATMSPNESIRSFVYVANYILRNHNSHDISIKIEKNEEETINEKLEQSTDENRKESPGEEWLKLLDRKRGANDHHDFR